MIFESRWPCLPLPPRRLVEARTRAAPAARPTMPADPASLAGANGTGTAPAKIDCPGCGTKFKPERERQLYCEPQCRMRASSRRARARRAAREDEEWRQRTRELQADIEQEHKVNGSAEPARPFVMPREERSANPDALAVPPLPWEQHSS